jgi:UPF0755 protein
MSRSFFLSLLFGLAIIFGLCIGVGMIAWGAAQIPAWTEEQFGPASSKLGQVQKLVLSAKLLRQAETVRQPLDPIGAEQSFRVELGESPTVIAGRLEQNGLIKSAATMRDYLVYAGLDTTIQAGDYKLSPRMNLMEIAQALQDATPAEVAFNILPGWRMEEIAAVLPTSGLNFTPEDFLRAASRPQPGSIISVELPEGATLEGFLFPDSYTVPRNISAQGFVNLLVDKFQAMLSTDLHQGFARQNLSLSQAVTLASIVQREAVVEEEMPLIASVFINRINSGIKLDADPTVQYSIGFNPQQNTWWTNPLTAEDLQTNSPYNTYLNWGLPPGPIANPGLKALQAVAFPAQTPYYFFRAACDGSGKHIFAETFEEHVGNACP